VIPDHGSLVPDRGAERPAVTNGEVNGEVRRPPSDLRTASWRAQRIPVSPRSRSRRPDRTLCGGAVAFLRSGIGPSPRVRRDGGMVS